MGRYSGRIGEAVTVRRPLHGVVGGQVEKKAHGSQGRLGALRVGLARVPAVALGVLANAGVSLGQSLLPSPVPTVGGEDPAVRLKTSGFVLLGLFGVIGVAYTAYRFTSYVREYMETREDQRLMAQAEANYRARMLAESAIPIVAETSFIEPVDDKTSVTIEIGEGDLPSIGGDDGSIIARGVGLTESRIGSVHSSVTNLSLSVSDNASTDAYDLPQLDPEVSSTFAILPENVR